MAADLDYTDYTDNATLSGLHPALDAFRSAFTTPEGQQWSSAATADVQDFLNQRQLADNARQAGEAFVNNLDAFKGHLVDMVNADPSTSPLAMRLVPNTIKALVSTTPAGDPEGEHADALTSHIQTAIAHTAVQSWARVSPDIARKTLDDYSDHLSDDDKQLLSAHIGVLDAAQQRDQAAQARVQASQAAQAADGRALDYLGMLQDRSGSFAPPAEWLTHMADDPQVPAAQSKALWDVFDQLQKQGDQPSDPGVVDRVTQDLASGAVSALDVIRQVGNGLSLADARFLAPMAFPGQAGRLTPISNALDMAQEQLAPPENGPAGQAAYARFVNWLLPAARAGADLNPNSKTYVLGGNAMQQFAPRPGDAIPLGTPTRSLDEIFGARR